MSSEVESLMSCRLGDVVTLKRGYDLPEQRRRPGRVPVYSSSGATGFHDHAKVQAPGVVTGRYGTLGRVFYVKEDFWPLNTALYVADFKGNDPRFISYLLTTLDFTILNDKSGVPGLNRNDLHEIEVEIPPRERQYAIACVLGALDDKIEANEDINRTLDQLRTSFFKSWFVDFDPVLARREGRPAFGVPADAIDFFPSHFEESELGAIPKDWKIVTVGDICQFCYGKPLPERARMTGNVPVLGSNGIVGTHTHAIVNGPGIVIGRKGTAGMVTWVATDFFPIDTTFYVRPRTTIPMGWIYETLRDLDLGHHSGDSAVPGLNRETAHSLKFVLPPDSLLRHFDDFWTPLRKIEDQNLAENQTLTQLRDTLLDPLVAGELTIKSAEDAIAAAL